MTTTISKDGDIALVCFDEGRGSSLSFESIAVLSRTLDEVEGSDARAVVLTGAGKVFCSGLDLRACSRYDRATMARFVDSFESLFERVFSFPLPIVASLNGHAMAGGAVIALACDVRVMATTAELALNEVELGLPFPSMAFEIGRFGFPAAAHVDGVLLGKRFTAQEALARGVVQAVCAPGDDKPALAWAKEFTTRGSNAVAAVKRMLRQEALDRARARALHSRRAFVDGFFGDDAQRRIGALVAKLEKR